MCEIFPKFNGDLIYIYMCVCVDILTFNKEKKNIIIFQFIHNRILSKTHKSVDI